MKKTASLLLVITLITSLFYNLVDYYMMISYQKEQSWIQQMQNTPDSEFKVIKLNATLYSFMEDTDIEKVNENIIIDNKIYHIFKKNIKDNVLNLYYLGVENQNAIDVSLKKIVDCQNNSDGSNSPIEKLIKTFSKDYLKTIANLNLSLNFKIHIAINKDFQPNGIENSGYLNNEYDPPKNV
ncbi:hypothetical protein [Flavobacterium sp.]|uniref:hypothetical protein n=1 Tax=Flavobacterium sp. TaxID=239 RepID=UPI0037528CE9